MFQDLLSNPPLSAFSGDEELLSGIHLNLQPSLIDAQNLLRQITDLNSIVSMQSLKIKQQEKTIRKLKVLLSTSTQEPVVQLPKHTTPAYFYFVQQRHPELVRQHPTLDFQQVGRIMGQEWQTVSCQFV